MVTLTLVSELIKLALSAGVFFNRQYATKRREHWLAAFRASRHYAVPAAIYVLDNNIMFGVLYFLRPSEVALLCNVSVVVTAFLFRTILKRRISLVQWSALISLMIGLMISRVGELSALAPLNLGHGLLMLQVCFGSFGNIYTEKVLKGNEAGAGQRDPATNAPAFASDLPLSLQNMFRTPAPV